MPAAPYLQLRICCFLAAPVQISQLYDLKQYKRALKSADAILKKFPNHGQTLAMKGLVLNGMGKKEEAFEQVRLGLKNDLRCVLPR